MRPALKVAGALLGVRLDIIARTIDRAASGVLARL